MESLEKTPFPLYNFLERLKHEGFIIGVDHYLKVLAVLKTFSPQSDPSELKYLLCPLFATSPKQQAEFYRLFDQYLALLPKQEKKEKKVSFQEEEPLRLKKWPYILIMVNMISLVLFISQIIYPPKPKEPESITIPDSDSGQQSPERLPDITVTIPIEKSPPLPLTFYQKYGQSIRVGAAALPVVVFFIFLLYRYQFKRLVLKRKSLKGPPLVWPIVVEPPELDYLNTRSFYRGAMYLRSRIESEIVKMDVKETIKESIQEMGFLKIQYRALSRKPEYLALIDMPDYTDAYGYFIKSLIERLKEEEEVHVEIYFYNRNPRVLFKSIGGKRYSLSEIKDKYRKHRLIIGSTGDSFLDPVSGEAGPWAHEFKEWSERALLTPREPVFWGKKEASLSRAFVVLPATTEGVEELVGYFENPEKYNVRKWIDKRKRPGVSAPEKPDTPESLREYLGEDYQWLCALAVYPELNWNLTLYLSKLCARQPLTEERIIRLIGLPWFRDGLIPEELKKKLKEELDKSKLNEIRAAIYKVLEKTPPPVQSLAWDTYQLNLAVHKWMLKGKTRKALEELRKKLKYVQESRIVEDYTLLSLLSSEPKSSHRVLQLPRWLKKVFCRKGITLLGIRTWVYACIALLVSIVLLTRIPEPKKPQISVASSITLEFAHIPAGSFMMGSPEDEQGRRVDERQHKVTLTKDFYIQKTEVTQAQWKAVMGNNPSTFKGCDDCPVETISWNDAQEFIKRLNKLDGRGRKYRLPTEAEWEYAARAGTTTPFAFGKCLSTDEANYNGNYPLKGCPEGEYRQKTIPVASLKPNAWGLYDMHGNVWEWCEDWYGDYPTKPVVDPKGPERGSARVLRGGGWILDAR
jgi:formylglycine-generating enzyme required for sulfatase activity